MKPQKQGAQAGIFPHGQAIYAAILKGLDGKPLERTVVVCDEKPAPAHMGCHVGQECPIAVDAWNIPEILIYIRNPYP